MTELFMKGVPSSIAGGTLYDPHTVLFSLKHRAWCWVTTVAHNSHQWVATWTPIVTLIVTCIWHRFCWVRVKTLSNLQHALSVSCANVKKATVLWGKERIGNIPGSQQCTIYMGRATARQAIQNVIQPTGARTTSAIISASKINEWILKVRF